MSKEVSDHYINTNNRRGIEGRERGNTLLLETIFIHCHSRTRKRRRVGLPTCRPSITRKLSLTSPNQTTLKSEATYENPDQQKDKGEL